jgi:hypothetical protein
MLSFWIKRTEMNEMSHIKGLEGETSYTSKILRLLLFLDKV